ncbi:MAG: adenylate/guanylate cyclase domain-containing protein, partial [Pseudomonadota bacterium]
QPAVDGVAGATIDAAPRSESMARISDPLGRTAYLLADRDSVLAHPALASATDAPRRLADFSQDPRLQDIWSDDRQTVIARPAMKRSDGHFFHREDGWRVFVYSEPFAFGDLQTQIGFHYGSDAGDVLEARQINRFWTLFGVSVGLLAAFCVAGAVIGARAARPLEALTRNASALQRLDFAACRTPPKTRIRELDAAGGAMDAMAAALRLFARHLPRHVMERVVGGETREVRAESQRITVLMTDIVGFRPLCAEMSAEETAALLSAHFSFIGAAIEASNDAARAEGRPPIRLRVALHTGMALVGEIGAVLRISYTAGGEAVDVAVRMTQTARDHLDGDVTILISQETRDLLGDAAAAPPVDDGPIPLFRI